MLDSVLVIGDIKFSRILEFREGDRQGELATAVQDDTN